MHEEENMEIDEDPGKEEENHEIDDSEQVFQKVMENLKPPIITKQRIIIKQKKD